MLGQNFSLNFGLIMDIDNDILSMMQTKRYTNLLIKVGVGDTNKWYVIINTCAYREESIRNTCKTILAISCLQFAGSSTSSAWGWPLTEW